MSDDVLSSKHFQPSATITISVYKPELRQTLMELINNTLNALDIRTEVHWADGPLALQAPEEVTRNLDELATKYVVNLEMAGPDQDVKTVLDDTEAQLPEDPLTQEYQEWARLPQGVAIWRDEEGRQQLYALRKGESLTDDGLIAPGMITPAEASKKHYRNSTVGTNHGAMRGEVGPEYGLPVERQVSSNPQEENKG